MKHIGHFITNPQFVICLFHPNYLVLQSSKTEYIYDEVRPKAYNILNGPWISVRCRKNVANYFSI